MAKTYTDEDRSRLSDEILENMIDGGMSCYQACKAAGVPNSTFTVWRNNDKDLDARYARAHEELINKMADEIISISDDPVGSTESGATDSGAVQKQRLQIDSRKWLLAKIAHKTYGEKIELSGDPDKPLFQRIERIVVGGD